MNKRYRSSRNARIKAMLRRDALAEDGWCINGEHHGLAAPGAKRCDPCILVHRGKAASRAEALGVAR